MSEEAGVLRVKPWGKDQGEYVRINECDFDPNFHELLDAPKKAESNGNPSDGLKVEELKAALEAKGIAYTADAKKADLAALLDTAE